MYAIPGFCQPVSSLSHLLAASAAIVAALPLIRTGKGKFARAALAVYATCVVALLAISGSYHALPLGGRARDLMQRVDYFAIWLLIAGTFTAVHGVMWRGFWRTGVLAFIWGYAAVGIMLQALWFKCFSGTPGLLLYLGLGWIGLGSIIKLGRVIGFRTVRPLWYAGICFSVGAILEAIRLPIVIRQWVGPHEVFHLTVIAGVLIHWLFIRQLVLVHAPKLSLNPLLPGPTLVTGTVPSGVS